MADSTHCTHQGAPSTVRGVEPHNDSHSIDRSYRKLAHRDGCREERVHASESRLWRVLTSRRAHPALTGPKTLAEKPWAGSVQLLPSSVREAEGSITDTPLSPLAGDPDGPPGDHVRVALEADPTGCGRMTRQTRALGKGTSTIAKRDVPVKFVGAAGARTHVRHHAHPQTGPTHLLRNAAATAVIARLGRPSRSFQSV